MMMQPSQYYVLNPKPVGSYGYCPQQYPGNVLQAIIPIMFIGLLGMMIVPMIKEMAKA
jgi:hypothetical protein